MPVRIAGTVEGDEEGVDMLGMQVAAACGRRVRMRTGGRAGALALAVLLGGLAPGAAWAHTYHETGAEQIYVVPPGAHSIHVAAVGGMGAAVTPGTAGGMGAFASATLPVTPGEVLYVEVGGNGLGPVGGFNGGADGDFQCCAGGGGGASDVRTVPAAAPGSLSSRLIVAGGGGGAGNGDGGAAGMPGASTSPCGDAVQFGGPGTLTGPGAGGFPCGTYATASNQGADGVFGAGGAGGFFGGGGGGGGYWGGGGGGGDAGGFGYSPPPSRCGGGGGGGSSFFSPSAAHTRLRTDMTGVPQVEIEADPPLIHRPHPAVQRGRPRQ